MSYCIFSRNFLKNWTAHMFESIDQLLRFRQWNVHGVCLPLRNWSCSWIVFHYFESSLTLFQYPTYWYESKSSFLFPDLSKGLYAKNLNKVHYHESFLVFRAWNWAKKPWVRQPSVRWLILYPMTLTVLTKCSFTSIICGSDLFRSF